MGVLSYEAALAAGIKRLEEAKIQEARLDAWYLLEDCTNITRSWYLLHKEEGIPEELFQIYMATIERRADNIPLQHITGEQEFMGLVFQVSDAVLIPRQDTEILVEEVLTEVKDRSVLDVCTGSGCIIISLAKLGSPSKAAATDISEAALAVARKNASTHQADVEFYQGDLFEHVTGSFDLIVSNPPYIPTDVIRDLMPEVRDHEPMLALDGKEDGLYFYHRIIKEARKYLNPEGQLFFEIGYDQGPALQALLEAEGYVDIRVIQDLAGLDRVVRARLPKR